MFRIIITLFILLLFELSGISQSNRTTRSNNQQNNKPVTTQTGSLNIHQDESFDEVLERYKNQNLENNDMPGYRIQIFFGSGREARDKAYEAKALFISDFPLVPAYVLYEAPYFKVRVGDYRTKREATSLFNQLNRKFPDAYITPLSRINLPPLEGDS